MAEHRITQANTLYQGKAVRGQTRDGIPVHLLTKVTIGAPIVADPDGIAAAQAVAGAGNLTLDGALASGGTVTLDVPRTVEIDSSNAGDTTQTATVTGTDVYGQPLVETITFNGTTAVAGQKAFKTVTQIAISAATTGNVNAGTTNVFGLPYVLTSRADILQVQADGVDELASCTIAVADTTSPATATTNDVRGTVLPNTTPNGTVVFTAWMWASDKDTLGVAQYGG